MGWSFKIARVAGIDIRIHGTFLLLLAIYGLAGLQAGGVSDAIYSVTFTLLLFLCVLLHEFGHAIAARAFGIRTPDITLLPIGGIARLERMPENPLQEIAVAIAGPLVNVAIACGLFFGIGHAVDFSDYRLLYRPAANLAYGLMWVNAMLVIFNLIPAFPMDGGRVLRALLATAMDHAKATAIAAKVGQAIAIAFAVWSLLGIAGVVNSSPWLLFIALFVFIGAQQEADFARLKAATAGLRVGDAMITRFQSLPSLATAQAAADEILHDTQQVYPIVDDGLRFVGLLTRHKILEAARKPAGHQPIGQIAQAVPSVRAEAGFGQAFELMQQSGSPVLAVTNPAGQIIGLVTLHLLQERSTLGSRA